MPQTIHSQITKELLPIYGPTEASIIAEMVLEKLTGQNSMTQRHLKAENLSSQQQLQLEEYLQQLLNHRPIQYVLNEAWFQNMPFFVDERVLIPRPETEELVEWVVQEEKNQAGITLLDIGSGSGCIPISLAKKLPKATIHSCDISPDALTVAQKNAATLNALVQWHQLDFLNPNHWRLLPAPDIIISNPPYIPASGAKEMSKHVADYEPGIALFVPDDNALVFYQAIADFCVHHGQPGARIYVEIHKDMARNVCDCFEKAGLTTIEVRRDMQGLERMVKARKKSA
ncbi:peptide chain release factor N(5)-glutamine methyltransferase [Flavihumibacter stibioxidans]|uniref:peptide chain release factor N(5)-glutamine methyltransferase n=1 Tax=Flavihumibacter stibioxidans TaxID=1834163 RepID=UPI0024835A93|nr:peptide chain release factor N(5)-glutamine methyltransferase [Flavihumibacter stibioxidans]